MFWIHCPLKSILFALGLAYYLGSEAQYGILFFLSAHVMKLKFTRSNILSKYFGIRRVT